MAGTPPAVQAVSTAVWTAAEGERLPRGRELGRKSPCFSQNEVPGAWTERFGERLEGGNPSKHGEAIRDLEGFLSHSEGRFGLDSTYPQVAPRCGALATVECC